MAEVKITDLAITGVTEDDWVFQVDDPTGEVSYQIESLNLRTYMQEGLVQSAALDLQLAYEGGNAISVGSVPGPVSLSDTDATDLLSLSRTFAGGGRGIHLSMGPDTTGHGILVDHEGSGDPVRVTNGAGGNLFRVLADGDLQVPDGAFIHAPTAGTNDFPIGIQFSGSAFRVHVDSDNNSRLTVDRNGVTQTVSLRVVDGGGHIFQSAPGTGMFRDGATDELLWELSGVEHMRLGTDGLTVEGEVTIADGHSVGTGGVGTLQLRSASSGLTFHAGGVERGRFSGDVFRVAGSGTAGSVAYGLRGASALGLFSPDDGTLGIATESTQAALFKSLLDANGDVGLHVTPAATVADTEGYTGLLVDIDVTGVTGSGDRRLLDVQRNSASEMYVTDQGRVVAAEFAFIGDTDLDTYITREAENTIGFYVNGQRRARLSTAAFTADRDILTTQGGSAANPSIGAGGGAGTGVGLFFPGANALGIAADSGEQLRVSAGEVRPGSDDAVTLGTASERWSAVHAVEVHTGDLHMTHEERGADWTLREHSDWIEALNNTTGQRYRVALEAV